MTSGQGDIQCWPCKNKDGIRFPEPIQKEADLCSSLADQPRLGSKLQVLVRDTKMAIVCTKHTYVYTGTHTHTYMHEHTLTNRHTCTCTTSGNKSASQSVLATDPGQLTDDVICWWIFPETLATEQNQIFGPQQLSPPAVGRDLSKTQVHLKSLILNPIHIGKQKQGFTLKAERKESSHRWFTIAESTWGPGRTPLATLRILPDF